MRFLVDAMLPRRLAGRLERCGHDAIHTLDLPGGNRSDDPDVADAADSGGRVLISKDADFVDSHFLRRRPRRLLLISTGNASNPELFAMLDPLLPRLPDAFEEADLVEVIFPGLILRGRPPGSG